MLQGCLVIDGPPDWQSVVIKFYRVGPANYQIGKEFEKVTPRVVVEVNMHKRFPAFLSFSSSLPEASRSASWWIWRTVGLPLLYWHVFNIFKTMFELPSSHTGNKSKPACSTFLWYDVFVNLTVRIDSMKAQIDHLDPFNILNFDVCVCVKRCMVTT